MAGLSPFTVMRNILSLNSANSVKTFRENSVRKGTFHWMARWCKSARGKLRMF